MYHNFFIHSNVDRYLSYFHVLGIVNIAAMNIAVHVLFQLWFFQGICPVVGLLQILYFNKTPHSLSAH